ncbi:mucin-binding protein [Lactobacillus agrestimuris]|uniref:mucin-binding protein n=1 Tax=Lactobacillus agrestimuris TaxID=2941328 RepID=UPI002044224C|nr:YSIRK-type signal peptide-containing protein [Lactobacillus agrestimuris]
MKYKNKTKNNKNNLITTEVNRHYSIRKFSVGVASVLIGSTLFLGSQGQKVQAADNNKPAVTEESNSQLSSDRDSSSSESDTVSRKELTPAVTSNEKKDNNATNPSVVNKPVNEQVSSSAQDDVAKQELSGDTNGAGNLDDNNNPSHKATSLNTDSNKFELTSTITNNTDHDDKNIFAVTVLPNTKDGKSQFDTHLTGPVEVEGVENAENVINWYVTGDVGKSLDTLLTKDKDGNYEPTKAALEKAIPEGSPKVTRVWKNKPDNWDQVTAVITTVDSLKAKSSLKIHLHTYDPSVENDVGKNAYMSQAVMDSTSFKKLRLGRTVNYVSVDGRDLGSSGPQNINDIAIYHTNAITGDIVGDIVLEKGLPEVGVPTFKGYKLTSISGGNSEFWQDYDPENPKEIFPVKVIKNLQDAKTNKVSGYAQIPNYFITVTYDTPHENTSIITGGGHANTLALFSMLAAVPQTPDKVEQHTSIINAGDSNSAKLTVVGKQKINISYIDDTDNKQIGQTDSVEGLPGETAAYSTADRINAYKKQGYVLVSDGTKSQDGQSTLIYDNDYQTDQNFEVHLKHETKPVEDDSTVTETIHYIYKDGATASPDKVQTINFKRIGTKDLVTQDVIWDPVTPQTFAKVDSPEISGYTPDVAAIDAITVNFGDQNIEKTVTYTANDQNAKITYIDDTTGTSLKSEAANGKFGELIEFPTDVDTQIKDYEDKGYKFVSKNFESNKYQADNAKNVFEVHLTHGYTTPERTVRHATWTINYVGTDHNPEAKQQKVTFTRTVYTDKVTNEVHDSGYVPDKQFEDVKSPEVDGYDVDIKTAHQDTVLGKDNTDGKFETTVIYTKPNEFVDTDTPVESHRATLTINYVGTDNNPKSVVQTVYFVKKGDQFVPTSNFEDVVSPEVNGYNLYNPDEFAKVHQDTKLGENDTDIDYVIDVPYVKDQPGTDLPDPMESTKQTWTIHYVGLDKNPDDVVQTIHFIKKGGKFVPVDSYEDDVKSPEVDGYDVDTKIAKAENATVLPDGNLETIVVYTKPNEFVDVPAKIADKKGIPGEPLVQDKLPAFTGGVPGIPLEQPELPKFEGGIPGIPLEQPNKPIAEIGIPNEPLDQPDLPIVPTPDTNIPDIPNPKIPEKQVPQKPTLSNPTPDPDPTPEVPVSNEDTSVKSGNITSDSFVSTRTNSSKVVPKKYRNTEKLLPQTGKKNSVALSMLGLATLSLTGLIVLATTKKKRRY